MSQRPPLPAPAVVLFGAALLLLGGCEAVYDDTKGWANRLEASILEATGDLPEDPEAKEAARYTPETEDDEAEAPMVEESSGTQTATLKRVPRPEGAPVLIEPNPAEDLRQDDLLLDELPNPADPAPTKEASAADPATGQAGPAAKAPAPPKRKPEAPQTAAQPTPGDDVAMVLHLSSLRSEQAAKREWSDLQRSFPEPLGTLDAEIRRTELGDKGVFYRVLAGPLPSRDAAKEVCAAVKSKNAKQYCQVMPSKPKG